MKLQCLCEQCQLASSKQWLPEKSEEGGGDGGRRREASLKMCVVSFDSRVFAATNHLVPPDHHCSLPL